MTRYKWSTAVTADLRLKRIQQHRWLHSSWSIELTQTHKHTDMHIHARTTNTHTHAENRHIHTPIHIHTHIDNNQTHPQREQQQQEELNCQTGSILEILRQGNQSLDWFFPWIWNGSSTKNNLGSPNYQGELWPILTTKHGKTSSTNEMYKWIWSCRIYWGPSSPV